MYAGCGDERHGVRGAAPADARRGRGQLAQALACTTRRRAPSAPHTAAEVSDATA